MLGKHMLSFNFANEIQIKGEEPMTFGSAEVDKDENVITFCFKTFKRIY